MKLLKRILPGLLLLISIQFQATKANESGHVIDSLNRVLLNTRSDTSKVRLLCLIAENLIRFDTPASVGAARKAYRLARKAEWQPGISQSLHALAMAHEANAELDSGIFYCKKSIEIDKASGDLQSLSRSYNSLAINYSQSGNLKQSTLILLKALEISKQAKDVLGESDIYINLANNYLKTGDIAKALNYDLLCVRILEKSDDHKSLAVAYSNTASDYLQLKLYEEALKFTQLGIDISSKQGDKSNTAAAYINQAKAYFNLGKNKESAIAINKAIQLIVELGDKDFLIEAYNNKATLLSSENNAVEAAGWLQKALLIAKELKNEYAMMYILHQCGANFVKQGNYNDALKYYFEAIPIAIKDSALADLEIIYTGIQTVYVAQHKFEKAYEYTLLYNEVHNQLSNKENSKQLSLIRTEFETEKKEQQIEILNTENALKANEIGKQKIIRNSFMGGFAFIFIIAGIVTNGYRQKKRANGLLQEKNITIERQKEIVELKNREITDSIEYALRIQTAILPPQKLVKQYLNESFVLYLPKDIVAGDFYWMEVVNEYILFAACDCTGHGVPGAMVSVVCHNALNRAVREFNIIEPAAILNKVAELVIENFAKSEDDIKDGMDTSLCVYNTRTKVLQWAGANNPLWLIKDGEFIETKADKQPIGKFEYNHPFTCHTFQLNEGDVIYVFSDGFADQFGGTNQKKLTKKRFKDLMLTIQPVDMNQQGKELEKFLFNYRNELEQIDDILVIGVKV